MTRLNYHVQLIPHGQKVSKGYKGLVNLRFPNPVGRTACTSFLSSKTSLKMVNWFSFKVIFSLPTALGRHVWCCGYTCAIQPEVRYFRTCNRIFHGSFQGNEDAEYAGVSVFKTTYGITQHPVAHAYKPLLVQSLTQRLRYPYQRNLTCSFSSTFSFIYYHFPLSLGFF